MPFSTIFTVSNPPRSWSSYTNIRAKDVQQLKAMNSTEGLHRYKEINDYSDSPTLSRRLLGYGYELPDKSLKKEKKWSIGSLFRRKKKDESDSSSDDDPQKKLTFLNRKKRKSDKPKRKPKTVGTFDHVVISQNSHLYSNGHNNDENGVLSDPTGGFSDYMNRSTLQSASQDVAKPVKNSRESLDDLNNSRISLGSGAGDSLTKRNRKGLTKIRAEARRHNLKHDSSSDEDSQRSASSLKFRSDESLGISNTPGSRRSRAARTERYLRRHSRDGENPSTKITKSDIENTGLNLKFSDENNRSLSRSPLVPENIIKKTSYSSLSSQSPSISGLSTIPPSHGSHSRIRVSNSTSNPSYKPPVSMNDYNYNLRKLPYDDYFNNQRSVSYDANIHKSPSNEIEPEIIHVQLALGKPDSKQRNLSLIDTRHVNSVKQPPPPPPRDPKRLVTVQNYDNSRPTTYYFDGVGQMRSKSFYTNPSQMLNDYQVKKFNSFNLHPSGRSTSEDQLIHNSLSNIQLLPRPSSATPEVNTNQKTPHQSLEKKIKQENYNYLMDKKPRSRRPIFIQTNGSESPATINSTENKSDGTKKALDFWREKDKEAKNKPKSPQMFTSQTCVQTQVFLPSVLHSDMNSENLVNSTDSLTRTTSPLQINSNENTNQTQFVNTDVNDEEIKRKSTNLEEALDELEAIYNSLKLGDEELLERAEQREKDAVNQKIREGLPVWGATRGTLSDSNFSYEPFDSIDSPRRKSRVSKRSHTVDRKFDDMAFRKLHKDHINTGNNDSQSVLSKVSYLQNSPVYGKEIDETSKHKKCKEPDITLDDVVYRNVKYANSSPKVVEPQPPFGIPLGPITLAANSDYLHAVPEDIPRPIFKPCKIPDLVKDDLAFRNLRKDSNKEPALPPLSYEDLKNNNNRMDINLLKKKRAVRSLSANIGSLIDKNVLAKRLEKNKDNNNIEKEFSTLTDIADAMEIARQVLREKENKINNTRKAFLSDTDTNIIDKNSSYYGKLAESRLNFLNSLKAPSVQTDNSDLLQTKPPTSERKSPRSPKESTPIPLSPLEKQQSFNNDCDDVIYGDFDDLLTALAAEARETSERITKELEEFDEETRRLNNNDNKIDIDTKLSEIDAVSEQAKLCEKLLEGVVDSSDFLNETEEKIEKYNIKPVVANVVMTREEIKNNENDRNRPPIESDHDYENLLSDNEIEKCSSPFEEHKVELIASFQELKKNIDLDDLRTVNSNIMDSNLSNINSSSSERKQQLVDDSVTGEDCFKQSHECVLSINKSSCNNCFNQKSHLVNNCDNIRLNRDNCNLENGNHLDSLDNLKSPKLVLETTKSNNNHDSRQILKNQSMIYGDIPSTSSSTDNAQQQGEIHNDGTRKSCPNWYRDPATLAVACSYGIACAHQLASLDLVAILGILFAVLSFIVALIF